jgi:L-ascorbate metabolism protein UlaG (beta-lactamase superfamily)
MGILSRAATGRRCARSRAAGSAPIAILAVLPMLALAAGASIRAELAFARQPPPQARGVAPDDAGTPPAPAPAADDDGPALARAAEAGLRRMRVQFSQSLIPALPDANALASPPATSPASGDARSRGALDRAAASLPPLRRLTLPPSGGSMRWPLLEGTVSLVGESTVLVRSHGFTVLTDPGFLRRGERARMGWGLSVARRADPAIDLDALPPIDVVVVSRLREDRFDRITRRRLPRDVAIVAPAQARAELVAMGFESVLALPAWGSLEIARGDATLTLTATPTRAGPPLPSSLLPTSMGTLMTFGRDEGRPDTFSYRIWVSGDTRIDDALLVELAPRLPGVDLALLHVGDGPLWIGGSMDAASAVQAAHRLGARTAIPLRLGDYGRAPAVAEPRQAAGHGPAESRFRMLGRGDVHRFGPPRHWALVDDLAAPRRTRAGPLSDR